MQEILNRLQVWREERGLNDIEFDGKLQASFIFEEIGVEYLRAKTEHDRIDALCDTFIFAVNGASLQSNLIDKNFYKEYSPSIKEILWMAGEISERPTISYLLVNIARCCLDIIRQMGYDDIKCLDETLKEIESRRGSIDKSTGKWEKFKDEESKKLWYKASYESCKL